MAKRPARKTIERKLVGEFIDHGMTLNGNHVEVSGTVVYSDGGSCRMEFDNGHEYSGVLNIVRLTFQTAGMKYAVTIDGKLIFEPTASLFPTLEEAAAFAGV